MQIKNVALPPLLFGEAYAKRHADARVFGDEVNHSFPGLNAYEPQGNPEQFFAKSCTLSLPNLNVVATAISPSYVDRSGAQRMTLMFPLIGSNCVTVDGERFEWGAGQAGIFMPDLNCRVNGVGDTRSHLLFSIQRQAIERTAAAMFGLAPDQRIDLELERARLTPVILADRSLEAVFRQLGTLIDLYSCQGPVASQWGLEEVFYRNLVGMLCPDKVIAVVEESGVDKHTRHGVLDRLCDEMLQNLSKRWTLTELEAMGGLSARNLQYSFKLRFRCSPMEWLREQRLQLARRRILLKDYATITQLAYQVGFASPSRFASSYKQRFGISPKDS